MCSSDLGRGGVALQKQGCEYMEYDEGRHREYVTRACMWLSTFFSVDKRRTLKVFRYSSCYPAELDWKGKILKLMEDTLVIKRKGERGRTIYIKSKDQSSPLKPALNPYNRGRQIMACLKTLCGRWCIHFIVLIVRRKRVPTRCSC